MADRVVRNIETDYLTCSICLGRYSDPKLLPCGHTFCGNCLNEHIKQTVQDNNMTQFSCPNDRTQIPRPSSSLLPKDWASAFPTDTFISSLLSAVALHENPDIDGTTINLDLQKKSKGHFCSEHDRKLEFFCLRCNMLACAYCAVKNHKGTQCECVSIDEAVVKYRPRIQALRRRFQSQIQKINVINTGEDLSELSLSMSQQQALHKIDELAKAVGLFYEFAMTQFEDLRKQVREASVGQLNQNQQLMVILDSIEATKTNFDNLCNDASGTEILNMLPKMEDQADEYETAMRTVQRSGSEIEFVPNVVFCSYLTKPPPVGLIRVMKRKHPEIEAVLNRQKRRMGLPLRHRAPEAVRPTITPRNIPRQLFPHLNNRRRRNKTSISVRHSNENTSCWQLTGLTFVDDSIVVVDAFNHMLRQCFLVGSPSQNKRLPIEYPLCITSLKSGNDIAVTQPEKRLISIIGTDGGLRMKNVIRTIKQYEGICQLDEDGRFVVSCIQNKMSIDIIDSEGRMQKCIERFHLFRWPRFLSVTSEGFVVVSDREQRHVVCMDQDGNVEWTFSAAASPWGVSCDGEGKIYMCLDSNYIHVLSENGNLLDNKFATNKDGIKTPYAICARGGQVAVTEYGSSLFSPNSPLVHMFNF